MELDQMCAKKLRSLRHARGLTLDEIERVTGGEFKSVVLGSYERGTRAISLARLERLSLFYQVPIAYFFTDAIEVNDSQTRWIFDLRQIRKVVSFGNEPSQVLSVIAYIHAIARKRNDWAGEVLSIRDCDRNSVRELLDNPNMEIEKELIARKLLI